MDKTSIFLELNGLSSSGIALGKVLGFARDEKTKTHQKHKMASDHLTRAKQMACEAFQKVKIIHDRNWKKMFLKVLTNVVTKHNNNPYDKKAFSTYKLSLWFWDLYKV